MLGTIVTAFGGATATYALFWTLLVQKVNPFKPASVEEVLARHPAVSEVSVIGAPDAEWGEIVVAFIVARPDHSPDPQELADWCRARIAAFKKPRRILFCADLPKNSYGKVLKTELRARLRAGGA